MSNEQKYRYYRREFINKPGHHSIAYVYASVEENTLEKLSKDKYGYTEVNLTIGDCTRSISLSLGLSTNDQTDNENALHKVDVLIDTLMNLKAAMAHEVELMKQSRVLYEASEKDKKSGKLTKKES